MPEKQQLGILTVCMTSVSTSGFLSHQLDIYFGELIFHLEADLKSDAMLSIYRVTWMTVDDCPVYVHSQSNIHTRNWGFPYLSGP